MHWLRYQHYIPSQREWLNIVEGETLPTDNVNRPRPTLITDFYAYNAKLHQAAHRAGSVLPVTGAHWVGDLAVTCDIDLQEADGKLSLELVEGPRRYQCHFDVTQGTARLEIDGAPGSFLDADGAPADTAREATEAIRGRGQHSLRFANVDDQLCLWVDGALVTFDGPTAYTSPPDLRPRWSPEDRGDLAPIGIGCQNLAGTVTRLQVHRDVYYVSVRFSTRGGIEEYNPTSELNRLAAWMASEQRAPGQGRRATYLEDYFRYPELWQDGDLFDQRQVEEFQLEKDQFFPMGDNSPSSKDARIWEAPHYVPRQLLIGKAFFIYYPQGQIPGFPGRMALENVRVVNAFPPDVTRIGKIR